MKNLILAIAFVLLAGCSLLNTSDFDNIEYDDFIEIMTSAEIAHEMCAADDANHLRGISTRIANAAHHLENYTTHRINNESTAEIARIIRETAEELEARYQNGHVSKIYCKAKTSNIVDQAKLGADAVQTKVRR